ncbi:uncharacterized protein LOC144447132 [Glandiceps talaboti]
MVLDAGKVFTLYVLFSKMVGVDALAITKCTLTCLQDPSKFCRDHDESISPRYRCDDCSTICPSPDESKPDEIIVSQECISKCSDYIRNDQHQSSMHYGFLGNTMSLDVVITMLVVLGVLLSVTSAIIILAQCMKRRQQSQKKKKKKEKPVTNGINGHVKKANEPPTPHQTAKAVDTAVTHSQESNSTSTCVVAEEEC